MKKKIFDIHLYREGLRQLKLTGLIYTFLLVLLAVLPTLSEVIGSSVGLYNEGFFDVFPYAVLVYCLFAPLMALTLFHFLTERNSCDFYHSIPQTRTCLFVSYTLSVLTWSLAMQWGTTLLATALHLCFPNVFFINVAGILRYSVQVSAAVVFVLGAVLLGISLTGTVFTNVVVALLIIFVPRGLMLTLQQTVGGTLTVVTESHYLSFFGNDWNVVTGGIFGAFTGSGDAVFASFAAGAYTFAIGIAYMILACLVFNRRKSEAAGNAALGSRMQAVIRLIPATVFCLIPDVIIFGYMARNISVDRTDIFTLFELYLVGVIIYFLYELVSTRKWKNVAKAAPGLVILAAVNLIIIFGMAGMQKGVLSFSPTADEIDYVCIPGGSAFSYSSGDYIGNEIGEIEITDENIRELVAERLAEGIAIDTSWDDGYSSRNLSGNYREVLISSKGRKKVRQINVTSADLKMMAEALTNNEEVRNIYMDLPDAGDPGVSISMDANDIGTEGAAAVYEALKQDMKNMGFEEWYLYCTDTYSDSGSYEWSYDVVTLTVNEGGVTRTAGFSLTAETPLATAEYLDRLWEMKSQSDWQDIGGSIEKYAAYMDAGAEFDYLNFDVIIYLPLEGGYSDAYYVDMTDEAKVQTLLGLLESQSDTPVAYGSNYLYVQIYLEYSVDDDGVLSYNGDSTPGDTYDMVNASCYLVIPDDFDMSVFNEITEEGVLN
ncbi:MAG: hypothetical protein LUC41_02180 [Clostridiales bacterium]|nr:hypothetical protein [Clostridiales bacterium]